jgi:hypothetical protein
LKGRNPIKNVQPVKNFTPAISGTQIQGTGPIKGFPAVNSSGKNFGSIGSGKFPGQNVRQPGRGGELNSGDGDASDPSKQLPVGGNAGPITNVRPVKDFTPVKIGTPIQGTGPIKGLPAVNQPGNNFGSIGTGRFPGQDVRQPGRGGELNSGDGDVSDPSKQLPVNGQPNPPRVPGVTIGEIRNPGGETANPAVGIGIPGGKANDLLKPGIGQEIIDRPDFTIRPPQDPGIGNPPVENPPVDPAPPAVQEPPVVEQPPVDVYPPYCPPGYCPPGYCPPPVFLPPIVQYPPVCNPCVTAVSERTIVVQPPVVEEVVVEEVAEEEVDPVLQLAVGQPAGLEAEGLGNVPGGVALEVGGVGLPVTVMSWKDTLLQIDVPFMGLNGPTPAKLHLFDSNGQPLASIPVELIVPAETAQAATAE